MNKRLFARQALLSFLMLSGSDITLADGKCPCTFDPEVIRSAYTSLKDKGVLGTCIAINGIVNSKNVTADGSPVVGSSVVLVIAGKPDSSPVGRYGGNIMGDVTKSTTIWSVGYTSMPLNAVMSALGAPPREELGTGRFCTNNGMMMAMAGTMTPLSYLTQYTACLNDIKAAAAAVNIPCTP